VARRDVDDEPPYSPIANRLQLGHHHLDVPTRQKRRAWIQFGKAAQHERIEIRPQRLLIFGVGKTGHEAPSPNRRVNSAMTDRIRITKAIGVLLDWSRLVGLDKRQQELRRARFARGGAIDQLLDCRLKLGDAPTAAALVDRDPFAQSRGDDRAEIAHTLRPAARVAGLAGAKA
jgi:hypothetical protein